MNEIVIIEQPDSVSWEEIRNTLIEAHKENLKNGLVVRSTMLTPEQLREQVGDGKCFLAYDGDKLVGVAAVRIKQCHQWFCHGKVAHFLLDSVIIDYQGRGVYSLLQKSRYSYVEEKGISIITTHTAVNNQRMVSLLPKLGFRRASMFHAIDTDHYSIMWVKWLSDEPCKFSRWFHYGESLVMSRVRFFIHSFKIRHKQNERE